MDHQNHATEVKQSFESQSDHGNKPRGSQSSDGVTNQTKEKGNKGGLEVAQNKELNTGKRTRGGLVQNKTRW